MEENSTPETKMKVALIAAIGSNRELGKDNQLLWHLADDMTFFKETTAKHYVLMGRKSFESIPKKYRPLPDRVNIIITRNPDYLFEECYTCNSLEEAVELARSNGEQRIFIIGGGEIYKEAIASGIVDEMYLTHVHGSFPTAQVFFPEFDVNDWNKTSIASFLGEGLNEFGFEIAHYEKKSEQLNPLETVSSKEDE